MKDIVFEKAGMENFCCYTTLMEYPFPNDKLTLISGPNGVGKSTIFDSVPFTLYGSTTKGLKGDDVVNNVVGKNCHTYVEFTAENNGVKDRYRVDRYVKHSKHGDTVLLFKNDFSKPFKKGHRETLPVIEDILVPQKLFTNTLLFGQKVKDFFTDLTDTEQKTIFRKVLQLDNYILYYDETSNRIKDESSKLDECSNKMLLNQKLSVSNDDRIKLVEEDKKQFEIRKTAEIQGLSDKLQEYNTELFEYKEKRKKYENINDFDLTNINNEISTIQNDVNNLELEKQHQEKDLDDLKNSKEAEFTSKSKELIAKEDLNKSEQTSSLNSQLNSYKLAIQESLLKISETKSRCSNTISSYKEKIEKNKGEILTLESSLRKAEATCPTCGQKLVNNEIKETLNGNLQNYYRENERMTSELTTLDDDLKQAIQSEIDIREDVKSTESQINIKLQGIESNYQSKVNDINQRLSEAKSKLLVMYNEKKKIIEDNISSKESGLKIKLDELTSKKDKLTKELEDKDGIDKDIASVESDIKTTKILLENKKKEEFNDNILVSCNEEKKRLVDEMKQLFNEQTEIKKYIEVLNFWKNGFSTTGLPSLLIDESYPFLNETVSNYLEMIGGRYVVSFDGLSTTKTGEYRDKINVNVLDTQTKANKHKQLSGGQTRIIDIAILLSLCDLQNNVQNMKTNILLLDEIFDSLDDQNISYVSALLRTLVKRKSINVISHRHIDSIEADEVIKLF